MFRKNNKYFLSSVIFCLLHKILFKVHLNQKEDSISWIFFFNFCWTHVHFWGHWYPCFGLLVMSPLGFKARVGRLIQTLQRHMWYTFPEIHLWCDTSAGVYGQHFLKLKMRNSTMKWMKFPNFANYEQWWPSRENRNVLLIILMKEKLYLFTD